MGEYVWKTVKVERDGETEPVVQRHLVLSNEGQQKQILEQARYMDELKQKGYIELPPDLAAVTGIVHWNPRDQDQTTRVLIAMAKDD